MKRAGPWLVSLLILAFSTGAAGAAPPSHDIQQALAPTGSLRVGVYRGSPSSILEGATPQDARGVGYDLGKSLAAALGVPFEPVIFPSNDRVLAAVKEGAVDVTFTNHTAERAKFMDFSQTYMDVEKSFLVPADSPIKSLADVNRPELRVGVSKGSSTAEELRAVYPNLTLVEVPTLKAAGEMLASRQIDAFATNKAILFHLSESVPGSRVLDGHWGMEHFGAAIPKGRERGMSFVDRFIETAKADGEVAKAIERAGLRGAVPNTGKD